MKTRTPTFLLLFLLIASCQPKVDVATNMTTPEPTPDMAEYREFVWKGKDLALMVPKVWTVTLDKDNLKSFEGRDKQGRQIAFSAAHTVDLSNAQAQGLIDNYRATYTKNGTEEMKDASVADFNGFEVIEKDATLTGTRRQIFAGVRTRGTSFQSINMICELRAESFEQNKQICSAVIHSLKAVGK